MKKFQQNYVNAMIEGDEKTIRAIERYNRNDYPITDEGYRQRTRDRIRAAFGEAEEYYY